ncbi:MAG: hypothetical protein IIT93_03285, partial [Paludibacteraceae bacterium]|nr:hypothetical protein [Paludibacteraceae bacterium]
RKKSYLYISLIDFNFTRDFFGAASEKRKLEGEELDAEIERFEGFLKGVMAKLSNERFIQNAKADIVERERKKKSDAESKLVSLREKLKQLNG